MSKQRSLKILLFKKHLNNFLMESSQKIHHFSPHYFIIFHQASPQSSSIVESRQTSKHISIQEYF
jgi:hypothetical protein